MCREEKSLRERIACISRFSQLKLLCLYSYLFRWQFKEFGLHYYYSFPPEQSTCDSWLYPPVMLHATSCCGLLLLAITSHNLKIMRQLTSGQDIGTDNMKSDFQNNEMEENHFIIGSETNYKKAEGPLLCKTPNGKKEYCRLIKGCSHRQKSTVQPLWSHAKQK